MKIMNRFALQLCVVLFFIPTVTTASGINKYCDLVGERYKEEGMAGLASFIDSCYDYEVSRRVVSRRNVEGCVVMDVLAFKIDQVFSEVYQIHPYPYFKETEVIKRTHERLIESGIARTSADTKKVYAHALESIRSCN